MRKGCIKHIKSRCINVKTTYGMTPNTITKQKSFVFCGLLGGPALGN